jgi:FemAB-related protein (PEP-CTERM system-associated)
MHPDLSITTSVNGPDWDTFLASHPHGSFYHLDGWRGVNERQLRHSCIYLSAYSGKNLAGVLPLVLVESRLFGRILCSLPFVNYGGPCSIDESTDAALVQAAIAKADELAVDFLELRCTRPLDTSLAVSMRKLSMTVKLAPDPETLWLAYTSKHRNNIKRAAKNGLTVVSGHTELLDEFYAVMQESWRDLGTPLYNKQYFAAILAALPNNTRLFICRHGKQPVAATFNGHLNGMVEGLWAGATPNARHLQANYVLYWEMIRDACLGGHQSFHLGRSTVNSGGEDFKRKWNADSTQLYWYYHRPSGGEMPALNVDNPKYKLAIATWRRMPLWLTGLIGPHLARLIP